MFSQKGQRLCFLDIAKGIMVLLVIFHHVPNVYGKIFGDMAIFLPIARWDYFYTVFFMQAFFLINGYTSNFEKPFKDFIIKDAKTLLTPFLVFGLLRFPVDAILLGNHSLYITMGQERYFYFFEANWFFPALFFARLLHWIVVHFIKKDWMQFLMWIFLLGISFGINKIYASHGIQLPSHYANWFHYRNGLAMGLFLWVGHFVKKRNLLNSFIWVGATIYLILIVFSLLSGSFFCDKLPVYTHWANFGINRVPEYIIYATTGSACILLLSHFIGKCGFLEYCGRNSGIIYGVQFGVLKIVSVFCKRWLLVTGYQQAIIWYLIVGVSSVAISVLLCKVFEIKWLRPLAGKF